MGSPGVEREAFDAVAAAQLADGVDGVQDAFVAFPDLDADVAGFVDPGEGCVCSAPAYVQAGPDALAGLEAGGSDASLPGAGRESGAFAGGPAAAVVALPCQRGQGGALLGEGLEGDPTCRGSRAWPRPAWLNVFGHAPFERPEPAPPESVSEPRRVTLGAARARTRSWPSGLSFDRYGHLMPGSEDEARGLLNAYLGRADDNGE